MALRFTTAGESHGPGLVTIVEGLPAGLELDRARLGPDDFATVDSSPVRCLHAETSEAMVAEIDRLRKANESLGGVFEVRAFGLLPGIGSYTSWEERLDGRLAQALVSIQAVKGVSVGGAG